VHNRNLPGGLLGILFVILIAWSCTKLDTTNLGSDLIPAVDNVNTFADTILVNSTQGLFADSTRLSRGENHVLGKINNDPLFGKTTANIYVQLKPGFYPYYFGKSGDTLTGPGTGLDSVVLCLSYKGAWGDTTQPQTLEVYEVNSAMFRDSIYTTHRIDFEPGIKPGLLGSTTIDVRRLDEQVKFAHGEDSVTNQIRIKLSNANSPFIDNLFNRDSSATDFTKNAFRNDSLFRQFTHGLAIKAVGTTSNSLMYINLADANTRLEVHFRKRRNNVIDTIYSSLKLRTNDFESPSTTVNHIKRERAGYPIENPAPTEHFLQTAPGTYVNLAMPRLDSFKDTNRIIHRASLVIEQIPGDPFYDSMFSAPPYMYLDLIDTTAVPRWKPIYIDLNPAIAYNPDNPNFYYPGYGNVSHSYFGSFPKKRLSPSGQTISYYNINISRYLQRMVTTHGTNYNMRLFPAFTFRYPQYSPAVLAYDNPIAYGRIRIGSGSHPQYRLRLIVVWSKIK
jgi:hypothetical protein